MFFEKIVVCSHYVKNALPVLPNMLEGDVVLPPGKDAPPFLPPKLNPGWFVWGPLKRLGFNV